MKNLNVFDKLRVLIYRYHEKSLEVFLIEPKMSDDKSVWKLPHSSIDHAKENLSITQEDEKEFIYLDQIQENDMAHQTIAIEGDYHDIPSIRGMIKHDVKRASNKIKHVLPDLEQGSFVAVKDVVKKVMPNEYQSIKELKEILMDRNSVYF